MTARNKALQGLLDAVEAGSLAQVSGEDIYKAFGSHRQARFVAAFNGSLDAAKALHEAVLPEWISTHTQLENKEWICKVVNPKGEEWPKWVSYPSSVAKNSDPARAWLIAILKALIAKEGDA